MNVHIPAIQEISGQIMKIISGVFGGNPLPVNNEGTKGICSKIISGNRAPAMAVFDGMGGESCGEMASYIAASSCQNLILGTITLLVCLIWNIKAKGYWKQLSVLAGLIVGYIVAVFYGKSRSLCYLFRRNHFLPEIMPYAPEFNPRSYFLCCNHFPCFRSRDNRRYYSNGFRRSGP